ncbi:enoyl-CoA hydratase-related protein [Amycolatopsis sp. NPDC049691]|uniref:enoyl-CoA hydratase-related protein n=1 Tax=Amycolatopsis sp. NPDC049691 TaxID=3155155 RepID=UPI003432E524
MERTEAERVTGREKLAASLYDALARGDREQLASLLHPDFVGRTTAGLPMDLGGTYRGADAMRREFWGGIARHFVARAEPASFHAVDGDSLLVIGTYTGNAKASGGVLHADFQHVLTFDGDRIRGLVQLTDSERWHQALNGSTDEFRTVEYSVTDGVGMLRLNRPKARNAINEAMPPELMEVAQRAAADTTLRALVISGHGPAFTVGGDIGAFADTARDDLPGVLRRMTRSYHTALRLLSEIDTPVIASVHGAVAGGGLGLLYVADVALAAENTKFATGFAALGLSGDGGNSWFLPRLVGLRRASELYFGERVLDAREALDWGLVSEVVPADQLEARTAEVTQRLANGPTRAYGEIRRLLRDSWAAGLPEQLHAETEALARTAATQDTAGAIDAFVHKTRPNFEGR